MSKIPKWSKIPEFVASVERGLTSTQLSQTFALPNSTARRYRKEALNSLRNTGGAVAKDDEWKLPVATQIPEPGRNVSTQPPKQFNIGGRWQRFVAGFDIHGDHQCEESNRVFFDFVETVWKPSVRICGGDLWDFRPLRKGASAEERSESMHNDYTAGMEWLKRLFAPNSDGQNYYLRGNHCERLWDMCGSNDGVSRDFGVAKTAIVETEIENLKAEMLPYHKRDGLLQLGHLKVCHGFYCGMNAAKQHAQTFGSIIFGHTHTFDSASVPGLDRRMAINVPALCDLDAEYNSRQPNTLRQSNGFAYGVLNQSTGDYHVWIAQNFGAGWMLPSDIVEMN